MVDEKGDLVVTEAEAGEGVQGPADPGHDPVAPPGRQPPAEQLEDAAPEGGARTEGRAHHGELVVVGEQRGAAVDVGHGSEL